MEPIVLVLIIISVIILIIFIGLCITAIVVPATQQGNNNVTTTPSCTSTTDLSKLLTIPNSGYNCNQNGITTSLYYVGDLGNKNYDYVVAPWTSQPLDVCIGFCQSYTNEICTGSNYNGLSAQQNFDNCMTQLSSTTCIPPSPIAIKDGILYYPLSPTAKICTSVS